MTDSNGTVKAVVLDRITAISSTLRPRFLGGLIVVSLAMLATAAFSQLDDQAIAKLVDLLGAPLVVVSIALVVYAVGALIELLADSIAIRAVAGAQTGLEEGRLAVARARGKPWYQADRNWFLRSAAQLGVGWQYVLMPLRVFFGAVARVSNAEVEVTREYVQGSASNTFDAAPMDVQRALSDPFGRTFELGTWYVLRRFQEPRDRLWAQRLILDAREVLIISTALLAFIVGSIFAYVLPQSATAVFMLVTNEKPDPAGEASVTMLRDQLRLVIGPDYWDQFGVRKTETAAAYRDFEERVFRNSFAGMHEKNPYEDLQFLFEFVEKRDGHLRSVNLDQVRSVDLALRMNWPLGVRNVAPRLSRHEKHVFSLVRLAAKQVSPDVSWPYIIVAVFFALFAVSGVIAVILAACARKLHGVTAILLRAADVVALESQQPTR